MECVHCKGLMKKSTAPFCVARNGYHVSWGDVPALVCTQCGEPYFQSREVDSIQQALSSLDQVTASHEVVTTNLPALMVGLTSLRNDPALTPDDRGARKLLVTEIYEQKEEEATDVLWTPKNASGKCPVQATMNTEVAVFNQYAKQDRHFHKEGTEIYIVTEGTMVIEVEGANHELSAGELIVVNPGSVHEVKPLHTEFTCWVVTANCGGQNDKFLPPSSTCDLKEMTHAKGEDKL